MKLIWATFTFALLAFGQTQKIESDTSIVVRTNELIDASKSDGRIFSGVVDENVMDASGRVAIPKGASAELVVKEMEDRELVLDLESVSFEGRRYAVSAGSSIGTDRREGIGANERTGKYVGGGALVGAIIGAIAGGGSGAAIGAAAGAGAGAGAQVLTRGKKVKVPAESLLTFRLAQPVEIGVADDGFTKGGRHYHRQRNR